MPIVIPHNKIYSSHYSLLRTAEEYGGQPLYYYSQTGVVIPNFKSGGRKVKNRMHIHIKAPFDKIKEPKIIGANNKRYFRAKHWTVYAGLNAVYNEHVAVNSGFALSDFGLINAKDITDFVYVYCDLEVQNTYYPNLRNSAFLFRVGFKLDMLVYFDR